MHSASIINVVTLLRTMRLYPFQAGFVYYVSRRALWGMHSTSAAPEHARVLPHLECQVTVLADRAVAKGGGVGWGQVVLVVPLSGGGAQEQVLGPKCHVQRRVIKRASVAGTNHNLIEGCVVLRVWQTPSGYRDCISYQTASAVFQCPLAAAANYTACLECKQAVLFSNTNMAAKTHAADVTATDAVPGCVGCCTCRSAGQMCMNM